MWQNISWYHDVLIISIVRPVLAGGSLIDSYSKWKLVVIDRMRGCYIIDVPVSTHPTFAFISTYDDNRVSILHHSLETHFERPVKFKAEISLAAHIRAVKPYFYRT